MKRLVGFRIAPHFLNVVPLIVEPPPWRCKPELFSRWLPTEAKHHAIAKSDLNHTRGGADIEIIGQFL